MTKSDELARRLFAGDGTLSEIKSTLEEYGEMVRQKAADTVNDRFKRTIWTAQDAGFVASITDKCRDAIKQMELP